jgi:TonB family protein
MGVVYLAEDPLIGRKVAIKGLRLDPHAEDQEIRTLQARFEQEIQIAGTFSHPNIVTLFDVGRDDGRTFIAMEYVEGRNLREELQASGPLPLERVIEIAVPLGRALAYAHERGVIHRDIKPTNILVSAEGIPKITDFGVARLFGSTMTHAGRIFGTPAYMSPEQAIGGELSGASDQFALATVAYELLTGERPFKGTSPTAVIYEVIEHHPTPPDEVAPLVPTAVGKVVMRGLQKNPQERFESCTAFANALQRAFEWSRANPAIAYIPEAARLIEEPPTLAGATAIRLAVLRSQARRLAKAVVARWEAARRSPALPRSDAAAGSSALARWGSAQTKVAEQLRAARTALARSPRAVRASAATAFSLTLLLVLVSWAASGIGSSGRTGDPAGAAPPGPTSRRAAERTPNPVRPTGLNEPQTPIESIYGEPSGASGWSTDLANIDAETAGEQGAALEDATSRSDASRPDDASTVAGDTGSNDRAARVFASGNLSGDAAAAAGAPGGALSSGRPPAPSKIRRLRAPGQIPEPRKIADAAPRLDGIEASGVVVLEIEVSARGNVVQARVLRGMTPAIDQAALDAVVRWGYEPPQAAGNAPVHVLMTVSVPINAR